MRTPVVSAIIPTYNRQRDVRIAVATAIGQTYPSSALEIIVVDDGGHDDTEAVLAREFGARVRYLRKPNGGASAARNFGMRHATGEYLALLDDDDEWRPTKIEQQVEHLVTRPEIAMVITAVERMDPQRAALEIFSRRVMMPVDGWALPQAMREPCLVTSSAMFRREVFEATGGFSPALPTAEDLDFFLRVALRFQIAVLDEPLTRAMCGHPQLSSLKRAQQDYVAVIERFVREHGHTLTPTDREAALFWAYSKNARGCMWQGDVAEAMRLARMAAVRARAPTELRELGRLGVDIARNAGVRMRRWMKAIGRRGARSQE